MKKEKKAKIAAILSLVFALIGIPLGVPFCILAVIEGEYFRKINREYNGTLKGKPLAIIGTILGILFLIIHGSNLIMLQHHK